MRNQLEGIPNDSTKNKKESCYLEKKGKSGINKLERDKANWIYLKISGTSPRWE